MNLYEILEHGSANDAALLIKPLVKSEGYVSLGLLNTDLNVAIFTVEDNIIKIIEKLDSSVNSLERKINSSIKNKNLMKDVFTNVSFCYHKRDNEYKLRLLSFNKEYTYLLRVLSVNNDTISSKLSFIYPYINTDLIKKCKNKYNVVSSEMLKKALNVVQEMPLITDDE
ncbi:Uncharacterised protein [Candidatus Tiddalikarchaeum anstoanum]|nr:Uncharacterised protein [Candidatus Tiddalikarchaeum anstoanum]